MTARNARAGARPSYPGLARELHNELPDLKGFSERNIKLMVQLASEYPRAFPAPDSIVPPPVAQLPSDPKVQLPVAQIPWAHNVLLMEKVKDLPTRLWYMQQTLANGWSRNVLALQIDARAHARQGKAVTNFAALLPAPQSDLAQQTAQRPLHLRLPHPHRAVPRARTRNRSSCRHLEKFLLELGQGFAFVGRQYRLDVGDEDFYIDLLFYHLRLRASSSSTSRRPVQARVRRQAELLLQRRRRPAQAPDRRPDHRPDPLPDARPTPCRVQLRRHRQADRHLDL